MSFDHIDHDALVAQVERRVCDRNMVMLIRAWLRAGVFEGGVVSATEAGTPQGSPLSPLLANIALHALDEAWEATGRRLGTLARYADDLVIAARPGNARAGPGAGRCGPGHVGSAIAPWQDSDRAPAPWRRGFDFLGFHHRRRESWRRPGRWFPLRWPSRRAMASIRAKVRQRTDRRYASLRSSRWSLHSTPCCGAGATTSVTATVTAVRGHRLLRAPTAGAVASVKHGVPGRNWSTRFNYAWYARLGTHRLEGTVRYGTAHAPR